MKLCNVTDILNFFFEQTTCTFIKYVLSYPIVEWRKYFKGFYNALDTKKINNRVLHADSGISHA